MIGLDHQVVRLTGRIGCKSRRANFFGRRQFSQVVGGRMPTLPQDGLWHMIKLTHFR